MKPYPFTLFALAALLAASFPVSAIEAPTFDATSDEAVVLRYKFSAGDQFTTHMTMKMTIKMDMGGMKMDAPADMDMDMVCKIAAIDENGNFQAEMSISHVAMKMEMMGTAFSFDSATNPNPTEPQFKLLAAMLNKTISATMTPRGQLVKFDTSSLEAGLAESGPQGEQVMQQLNQMMNNLFIGLPEGPVTAGGEYDGGTITQTIPDVGEMVLEVRYKVLSVSADLKQAILEPSVTMTLKAKEGAPATMNMTMEKYEGWILFDVEGGNLVKSNILSTMHMTMEQLGQKMDMLMDMDVACAIE